MKLKDVNIKVARFKPRNMMVMFNFIYFELKMINFERGQMNPNSKNQYEIVYGS